MPLTHWLLAIAAVFVWGTNFVVITWGLADFPPFLLSTLRFLFTAVPGILLIKRPSLPWRTLAAFGAIAAGQFGLLYIAMHRFITPGLASLLIQTQVVFTILLSLAVKPYRLKSLQLTGLALALVGIGLVAWRSATSAGATVTLVGVILILAAALCWAVGNLIVQSSGSVNVVAFLVWSSLFAVPPLLLLTLSFDGPVRALYSLTHAGLRAWAAVVWQALGNTIFGFGIWNWLLARHAAATVTPVALLVPVFGMTASAWLLAESLPLWKAAAAGLVLAGLALNAYSGRNIRSLNERPNGATP
jgi:O-acetylserine/cysteine efflux transporter